MSLALNWNTPSPVLTWPTAASLVDFAFAVLMSKRVRLSIDDRSAAGIPTAGQHPAARLTRIYGQSMAARNLSRLQMDRGHAGLEFFANNEHRCQMNHSLQSISKKIWLMLKNKIALYFLYHL